MIILWTNILGATKGFFNTDHLFNLESYNMCCKLLSITKSWFNIDLLIYSLNKSYLETPLFIILSLKCCSSLRMHYFQVSPIFFLLNVADTLKALKTQQNWIRPPKNSQTFTFSKFLSFINVSRAMMSSVIAWNIVVCVPW